MNQIKTIMCFLILYLQLRLCVCGGKETTGLVERQPRSIFDLWTVSFHLSLFETTAHVDITGTPNQWRHKVIQTAQRRDRQRPLSSGTRAFCMLLNTKHSVRKWVHYETQSVAMYIETQWSHCFHFHCPRSTPLSQKETAEGSTSFGVKIHKSCLIWFLEIVACDSGPRVPWRRHSGDDN